MQSPHGNVGLCTATARSHGLISARVPGATISARVPGATASR